MRIYLAGPLFTRAERTFNTDLAVMLRQSGHEVWVPQDNEPREFSAEAIFAKDVEGVDWCDVIVANMDGSDPDSGTAWECGYGYAKGKPIVCFRTDFRGGGEGKGFNYNLMLFASAYTKLDFPMNATLSYIADHIQMALYNLENSDARPQNSPTQI